MTSPYDVAMRSVGRVAKTSRRFVWVEYPDEIGLMVTTYAYKKDGIHKRLKHHKEFIEEAVQDIVLTG
jgi:hypothetical protein